LGTIVTDVRLPRATTALLAGAAVGVGGLQMQTLFRNPLADPFILGISAGASLGVAFVVLLVGTAGTSLVAGLGPLGNVGVAGAAAVGAGVTIAAVLLVSRRVTSPATVLIIGLMAGYATSAVVSVLIHTGIGRLERIRAYIAWGFGSFAGTTWSELAVLAPCVAAGLVLAGAMTKQLNAMLLGDRYAASMGLRVRRARLLVIAGASLLAGATTAFCGPIAFVGVAAPHMARGLLRTSDHRVLVGASGLAGAVVALVAGLVAQVPGSDATLPLNAVTSLIGAPVVVAILLRMRRAGQGVTA
jgi:iron complex transport system permease protein